MTTVDPILEKAPEYLLSQGVLGVACLALIWVVIRLYNKTESQQERILDEMEKRVTATQEAIQTVRASSHEQKELTNLLVKLTRSLPPKRSSETE